MRKYCLTLYHPTISDFIVYNKRGKTKPLLNFTKCPIYGDSLLFTDLIKN